MHDAITHETRHKVAKIIANDLTRRHAWVDRAEAEQQAYLALLIAEEKNTYDPTRGHHWLYVVARRELSAWIFKQRSVISATSTVLRDAKLREPKGHAKEFANLTRRSMPCDHGAQEQVDRFAELAAEEWAEAVKMRIMQLLDPEIIELLFSEEKPTGSKRERRSSWTALRNARNRIRNDAALRDLWQVV